ncbi:MAG: LysR substrate-binding domain-containing protein [Pseudomonadota bacterium]
MRFRHYDQLRRFCLIARYSSFTEAAAALNLTKGAVSYQIDQLEEALGFALFHRDKTGISLTRQGQALLPSVINAFADIENEITQLRQQDRSAITIGMATYFASRWLSPRLMHFITAHPEIGLRIQPLIDLTDLRSNDLDMAIRWGKGDWPDDDLICERIFNCPAVLSSSIEIGKAIESRGIEAVINECDLLHDGDGSAAWQDWFEVAGLEYAPRSSGLIIPDPNVRVQAVIDGQGIALYDRLLNDEVAGKKLYQYKQVALEDYGYYLVHPKQSMTDSAISVFRDWIMQQAIQG